MVVTTSGQVNYRDLYGRTSSRGSVLRRSVGAAGRWLSTEQRQIRRSLVDEQQKWPAPSDNCSVEQLPQHSLAPHVRWRAQRPAGGTIPIRVVTATKARPIKGFVEGRNNAFPESVETSLLIILPKLARV